MTDEEKVDPMVQIIRETIKNGGEVTLTLKGIRPGDEAEASDEEVDDE